MGASWLFILFFLPYSTADYCGEGRMPIGFEVSHKGKIRLNCDRPDCMDRQFAECPEIAESLSCPENVTWVGGIDQRVDGTIRLRCCKYPRLMIYGEDLFHNITLHAGNYFESAVKFIEESKKDMEWFDLISNVEQKMMANGSYVYTLTVNRFNCSQLPEEPPGWWKESAWPFWLDF